MKIALFSDIHANLPALEACLKSIDEQKPDAIYCLGDLVGYNIWPNEVINEIRRRGIPTIAGNYDQGIGLMSDECGCAYKTDEEKDMGKISISYTNSIVKPEERNYLRTLPAHIKIEFGLNGDKLNLLLVHGSPRKINEYLFEDRDEKACCGSWKTRMQILCVSVTPTSLTIEYCQQKQLKTRTTVMPLILVPWANQKMEILKGVMFFLQLMLMPAVEIKMRCMLNLYGSAMMLKKQLKQLRTVLCQTNMPVC